MIRSATITDSFRPSQDDLLAFIEGQLAPEREAAVRRALGEVPGALERAEAMRQDKALMRRGVTPPETARAPVSAAQQAMRSALGARPRTGWRRWTPALVGAGGLAAAAAAWVILVQSGGLEPAPDNDLDRLTIVPKSPSTPPPARADESDVDLNAFLANAPASASTMSPVPEPITAASAPLPNQVWLGIDDWGIERPVDTMEAASWLWDGRLAVVLRVPDARGREDQMRLLSLVNSVRLVHEPISSPQRGEGGEQHAGASPTPTTGARNPVRSLLYGVIDQGPGYDDAGSTLNDGVIRALDAWLTELPLVEGGELELEELNAAQRLPGPPEEWKDTTLTRQHLLLIRIREDGLPSSSSVRSPLELPKGAPPWMDGPGRDARPPLRQPAPR
ncbi:MAG: hypothetical protein KDA20_11430 [Phycisphaerales bacterium]|nr:hypothetical protein [Phycisphaerales bacterium]